MEQHSEGSNENFRVFISAEPAPSPDGHIIPQGILENSIKITNEPPTGMHANLHKAFDNFNQVTYGTDAVNPLLSRKNTETFKLNLKFWLTLFSGVAELSVVFYMCQKWHKLDNLWQTAPVS